jgi:hypothetical protein
VQLPLFPLPFPSYPLLVNSFQYIWLCHVLAQMHSIVDCLSFPFPFPPPLSSVEQFHYYKHVLYTSVYMIMFIFVCMFIFWIYLLHVRENMWPLSFWNWFTLLNIMSSSSIHLHANNIVSIFFMTININWTSALRHITLFCNYLFSGLFYQTISVAKLMANI